MRWTMSLRWHLILTFIIALAATRACLSADPHQQACAGKLQGRLRYSMHFNDRIAPSCTWTSETQVGPLNMRLLMLLVDVPFIEHALGPAMATLSVAMVCYTRGGRSMRRVSWRSMAMVLLLHLPGTAGMSSATPAGGSSMYLILAVLVAFGTHAAMTHAGDHCDKFTHFVNAICKSVHARCFTGITWGHAQNSCEVTRKYE